MNSDREIAFQNSNVNYTPKDRPFIEEQLFKHEIEIEPDEDFINQFKEFNLIDYDEDKEDDEESKMMASIVSLVIDELSKLHVYKMENKKYKDISEFPTFSSLIDEFIHEMQYI